ncbi:MAG: DUF1236 domain-containing protein [Xanthobacteraceae bacterium]|nr:DUF1236 domain-containing protein [Xanthobacteraceae bacterium]
MKIRTVVLVTSLALVPGIALAQNPVRDGARDGAAAGGTILGAPGAIVGGTVGAAVGTAVAIPDAVISSVRGERVPSVTVRERVVVGEPLPDAVVLRPVPSYSEYNYAVVNDQRVIVDPHTRRVVRIVE